MNQLIINGHTFPCVVSDVDGVLVKTFKLQYKSFKIVVKNDPSLAKRFEEKFKKEFNFQTFNEQCNARTRPEQIRNLFDLPDDKLIDERVDEIGKLKDAEYQKFKDSGKIEKFDEIVFLLEALKKNNIPVAFVSGSTSAAEVLKIVGLLDYFTIGVFPDPKSKPNKDGTRIHAYIKPQISGDSILSFTEAFHPKPKEAAYAKGAEMLGFSGQPFLVLEDSSEVAQTKYEKMQVAYIGPETDLKPEKETHAICCFETHADCAKTLSNRIVSTEYLLGVKSCIFQTPKSSNETERLQLELVVK